MISTAETEIQHANVILEKTPSRKKNCWGPFYSGENMVYVILPRPLMHRPCYCWTAATKVKAAQGLLLLTQLPKDFKEIWRKIRVEHDTLHCSLLFYKFLLPPLGYPQHVALSLMRFHECALISWREMKEPYHAAFSFKLEKILYPEWSE